MTGKDGNVQWFLCNVTDELDFESVDSLVWRLDDLPGGTVVAHFELVDADPLPLRADVTYKFTQGQPGMRMVGLDLYLEDGSDDAIDTTIIRKVPFLQFQSDLIEWLEKDYPTRTPLPLENGLVPIEVRKQWPKGDLGQVFYYLQWVYDNAVKYNLRSTDEVARMFDVSRATAGRMIQKARAAGISLSTPVNSPRKGRNDGQENPGGRGAGKY